MNYTFKILLLVLIPGINISSCKREVVIPDSPAISFTNDIQGIIVGNCTQSVCHSSSGGDHRFPLLTYNDVMEIVKPGNASDSKLFKSITGKSNDWMPPAPQSSLNDQQIKLIYLWIEQGAKNN